MTQADVECWECWDGVGMGEKRWHQDAPSWVPPGGTKQVEAVETDGFAMPNSVKQAALPQFILLHFSLVSIKTCRWTRSSCDIFKADSCQCSSLRNLPGEDFCSCMYVSALSLWSTFQKKYSWISFCQKYCQVLSYYIEHSPATSCEILVNSTSILDGALTLFVPPMSV